MTLNFGRIRVLAAIAAAVGLVWLGPSPARAACDTGDDNIDALCNALTGTLNTIGSKVTSTANEVTGTASTTLKGTTNNIWGVLTVAQGQFNAVNELGENFYTVLDGALAQVKYQVDTQGERLTGFLGDDGCSAQCEDLRTQLITLVIRIESLTNTLAGFQGTGQPFAGSVALPQFPEANLQLLKDFLQNAPGFALYPLHEIFQALLQATGGDFLAELNATLLRAEASAALLQDIARAPAVLPPTSSTLIRGQVIGEGEEMCTWWKDQNNRATLSAYLSDAVVASGLLRLFGKVFTSLGQTELEEEGQVHGYVGVVLKDNWPKKIGNWLGGLGELLSALATGAHAKMVRCDIEEIRAMQAAFLSNQAQILKNQAYIACVVSAIPRGLPGIKACAN